MAVLLMTIIINNIIITVNILFCFCNTNVFKSFPFIKCIRHFVWLLIMKMWERALLIYFWSIMIQKAKFKKKINLIDFNTNLLGSPSNRQVNKKEIRRVSEIITFDYIIWSFCDHWWEMIIKLYACFCLPLNEHYLAIKRKKHFYLIYFELILSNESFFKNKISHV